MTRAARTLLLISSLLLLVWAAPGTASAQGGVELQLVTSTRRVEVGEPFQVSLSAFSSGGDTPRAPRLTVPAGFSVQGPSVSSQQQVSISGGVFQQRVGISATWILTPTRPGRYTIGPASVQVGRRTASGNSASVEVVGQGQAGPRSRGSPFDPLDPFGGFGRFPNFPRIPPIPGWDEPSPDDQAMRFATAPEEYSMEQARDPTAFVRAVAEPKQVVVGQPLVLRVFGYSRGGPFADSAAQEPSRADFVSYPVLQSSEKETFYRVTIAGESWVTRKLREFVLVPLRVGRLGIGSMKVGLELTGSRHKHVDRQTEALEVVVTEPPIQGRPPGYQLGDVGRFTLSATVEPRRCQRGDSISVVAKLEGSGNFPLKLRLPQQRGLEWLEPTVVDDLAPKRSSIVGSRRFTYVLRVDREGEVDLGELRLSYWQPDRQAYATAKVTLGSIEVSASAAGKVAQPAAATDPLKDVLVARTRLGDPGRHGSSWGDSPWYWGILALGPLGVLLGRGGVRGVRALLGRWRARHRSTEHLASVALSEAKRAAAEANLAQAASSVERALYLGIERTTGLRARALLRLELEERLIEAGLSPALAEAIRAVLDDCDTVRFTGTLVSGGSDLIERATKLMAELGSAQRSNPSRRGDA